MAKVDTLAHLKRADANGIAWPIPPEIDDTTLERHPFPPIETAQDAARPLPDWKEVQKELKRRGVTLQLLWDEYRAEHGDGYCYSHFCELHREWLKTVSPTMRQTRAAGDPTLADAILDRLVHNSHRLVLKGESLRKAAAKRQKLAPSQANELMRPTDPESMPPGGRLRSEQTADFAGIRTPEWMTAITSHRSASTESSTR